MLASRVHARIPATALGIENFDVEHHQQLDRLGIVIPKDKLRQMSTMDAIQPTVTTANINTPIQFLQAWLPGQVHILTSPRVIDELIGVDIVGAWFDEEVVQTILELTGKAVPYSGYQNVPLSSYNMNYERNTVVRFEEGMLVENMEAERASRVGVSADSSKRQASTIALEISRNLTGFFGFNNGAGRTYGFLNAPGLPGYVTVPNGASGSPLWANKTTLEIIRDIRVAIAAVRTKSRGAIDPKKLAITLALGVNAIDALSTPTDLGYSVLEWIEKNYPKIRVVCATQLDDANGGVGVFYLFADSIDTSQDLSTDGGRTFAQNVQAKFLVNGVEKKAKGYLEDYLNATAGVMLKRPYAVVRYSGIS